MDNQSRDTGKHEPEQLGNDGHVHADRERNWASKFLSFLSPDNALNFANYVKQITDMARRSQQWRRDNPDEEVEIIYNFPIAEVPLVGEFERAVDLGFVKRNGAARQMVAYMCAPYTGRLSPTVMMIKVATELPMQEEV